MSHIHLPDGVLPPIWWIAGFIICFIFLGLSVRRVKSSELRRKIPFIGVVAALMLIFMSVPLGIIPVHLSLAVLCGIMAGPALGFIAVFVVNIILAMMGHGGITSVGINTLILGSEVVVGYYVFAMLSKRINLTASSVSANIIALLVSTALMTSFLIAATGAEAILPVEHNHNHDHAAELEQDVDEHNHSHDHAAELEQDVDEHSHFADTDNVNEEAGHDDFQEALDSVSYLSFTGWTALVLILITGILTESLITGLIISFFSKVRPDLIGHAL